MLVFWMVAISFCVVAVAFVVAPMWIRRNAGNTNRMGLNVALYRDRISELEKSRSAGEISDEEFAQLEKDLQLVLLADDGDEVDGDGCNANCEVELGWSCNGEPSICLEVCGDELITGAEQCDDGNANDSDGSMPKHTSNWTIHFTVRLAKIK